MALAATRTVPPSRLTSARYLALVEARVLMPEDRVELLEGVIVAMSPHTPAQAAGIYRVHEVLRTAVGARALVRGQLSLVAGARSVPEPDVSVVPGTPRDYETIHPSRALLVVEVAEASLPHDRLTKSAIYAAAGVPEYWIVNLRDDCVEVFRRPSARRKCYQSARVVRRGARLRLVALPGVALAVADLLPTAAP